jgi:hypothetical protein
VSLLPEPFFLTHIFLLLLLLVLLWLLLAAKRPASRVQHRRPACDGAAVQEPHPLLLRQHAHDAAC